MKFDSNTWCTPDYIFEYAEKEFGNSFTLDPCCFPHTARAKKYFTPKENGLLQSWRGERVFCNPPYGRGLINMWVNKCIVESGWADIVALLPADTSTKWYHVLEPYALNIEFIKGRVEFVAPDGSGKTFRPRMGSMLVTL